MIRPPPISTLFPYTPLFRSEHDRRRGRARVVARGDPRLRQPLADELRGVGEHGTAGDVVGVVVAVDDIANGLIGHGGDGDRKSTRLNSSHLVISYAVFCLKK